MYQEGASLSHQILKNQHNTVSMCGSTLTQLLNGITCVVTVEETSSQLDWNPLQEPYCCLHNNPTLADFVCMPRRLDTMRLL